MRNLEVLVAVKACPLCASPDSSAWREVDNWKLRRCAGCTLGRLDPRPTAEALTELYGAEYFAGRASQEPNRRAQKRTRRMMNNRVRLAQKFVKSGRLLDAGCGEGEFLEAARDAGFEVEGFDLSPVAVEKARGRGLQVSPGGIGNAQAAGPFDVLTAWHVLEHVAEPLRALDWLRERLAPNGLLVVEAPNCESLDARKFGAAWRGWQPPVHLWHFSPQTLQRALRQSGFEPLATRFEASAYLRGQAGKIPLLKIAKSIVAHAGSGTSVTVVARRND